MQFCPEKQFFKNYFVKSCDFFFFILVNCSTLTRKKKIKVPAQAFKPAFGIFLLNTFINIVSWNGTFDHVKSVISL